MKYVLAAILGMLAMAAFVGAVIIWLQMLVLSPLLVSVITLLTFGAGFGLSFITPYISRFLR